MAHSALDHPVALEVLGQLLQQQGRGLLIIMAVQLQRRLPSSATSSGAPTTMLPQVTSLQQQQMQPGKDQAYLRT
jgi:hypothetical protein